MLHCDSKCDCDGDGDGEDGAASCVCMPADAAHARFHMRLASLMRHRHFSYQRKLFKVEQRFDTQAGVMGAVLYNTRRIIEEAD